MAEASSIMAIERWKDQMRDEGYGNIRLRVSDLMGQRKLKITDLRDRAGISYPTAKALFYEDIDGISFKVLAAIYEALECESFDELLEFVPNGGKEDA